MRKEIKIGLTVLAGLIVLYLAIAWVKSIHFFSASASTYQIVFQDVAGLKEGDQVTVFGYPSGNVESIGLDNRGALVRINLKEDIKVMSDASAEIRVKELMGGKLIAFTPGLSGTPLGPDEVIVGETSLDFSSAFAKAGEFLDKFDMEQVDSIVSNVNKIASSFARVADELDELDTGALLEDVNQSADRLNSILTDVEQRQLVKDIDERLARINLLADNADRTLGSFEKLADNISDKTLPSVDKTLDQIGGMLDDAEEMVVVLKDLTKQMQNQNTLAGKILYDPELANDFDNTLDNLNTTLNHLRTKKIHVRMSLSKKQRFFKDEVDQDEE